MQLEGELMTAQNRVNQPGSAGINDLACQGLVEHLLTFKIVQQMALLSANAYPLRLRRVTWIKMGSG